MKKALLLCLALVATFTTNAWGTYYKSTNGSGTLGELTLNDITNAVSHGGANDGSITVALSIASDNTANYPSGAYNYFLSIDNDKLTTLADKNVFTIEAGSTSGTYIIKDQSGNYVVAGDNGNNVTTSTTKGGAVNLTLSEVTPSDNWSGWTGAKFIRFAQNGTFINCQNRTAYTGWRNGTGGYSAYVVWRVTTEAPSIAYKVNIIGDPKGTATVTVGGNQYTNGQNTAAVTSDVAEAATCAQVANCGSVIAVAGSNINVTYFVNDLAGLSNERAYTISVPRGPIHYNGTKMSGANETIEGNNGKFGIIKSDGENYYLYNVGATKYMANVNNFISDTPAVVTINDNTTGTKKNTNPYFIKFGTNFLNIGGSNQVTIDTWSTMDDGNQIQIVDAGAYDFSAIVTEVNNFEAVADLTALTAALTKAQAIYNLLGNGYGKYTEANSGDLNAAIAVGITFNNETPASQQADVNTATANLNTAISNASINVPADGSFIRIKGETSGKYIASGLATNNKFNMSDATDNSTLFYYKDGKLLNVGSGMWNGMNSGSWTWQDNVANASTVTFAQGNLVGYYTVHSTSAYFFDNGNGSPSSTDRGGSYDNRDQYHKWTLIAVENPTIPVQITTSGFATFSNYFALDFTGLGVTAYKAKLNAGKNGVTLTPLTTVAGNTGIFLAGTASQSYNVPIYTGNEFSDVNDNILEPTTGGELSAGDYVYVIDQNAFCELTNTPVVSAGKAYIPASVITNGAKALSIDFDGETAIENVNANANANANVFNLAGQKVNANYRGIVIENGKKVLR